MIFELLCRIWSVRHLTGSFCFQLGGRGDVSLFRKQIRRGKSQGESEPTCRAGPAGQSDPGDNSRGCETRTDVAYSGENVSKSAYASRYAAKRSPIKTSQLVIGFLLEEKSGFRE